MKKLVIDSISDSAQMPIKKGTLQFLQDANYEALQSIVLAAIGSSYDPTKVYVLYGCINSGSGNSYTITAGAVFYAGEIYLVDAASFTASGSNVGVFSIAITQYTNNADPVTFADTTIQNVHNIRKMLISAGASGSTIGDYSARSPFSFFVPPQLILTGAGIASISGSYPNIKITVPQSINSNPALFAGSVMVGNVAGGTGNDFTITFPSPLNTANYYVMGSFVNNPTSTNFISDTSVQFTVRNRTATGFILHVQEWGSNTQDISWEYIIFAK